MVIIVFGLPGSGKTYFANRLAKKLNAVHLNSDIIRREVGEWDKYSTGSKEIVYDVLLGKMREVVSSKKDAVIDATFYKKKFRDNFLSVAEQLQQSCKMIEVHATEKTISKRLLKPREGSQADYNVYQQIKNEFEPVTEKHLVLFSDKETLGEMIERATEYLSGE